MTRRFSPREFVTLPLLNASETLTLLTMLESQARSMGNLSAPIEEILRELVVCRDALGAEVAKRKDTSSPAAVTGAADLQLDRCWSALSTLFSAWFKLGVEPQCELAISLNTRLFPEGLTFLNHTYAIEWAESETKLKIIDAEELAPKIESLGGAPFLTRLRGAHQTYGETLGITRAKDGRSENPDIQTKRTEALDCLRDYVTQVGASVRRNNPESAAHAEMLLGPLREWRSRKPGSGEPEVPNSPNTGTPIVIGDGGVV